MPTRKCVIGADKALTPLDFQMAFFGEESGVEEENQTENRRDRQAEGWMSG